MQDKKLTTLVNGAYQLQKERIETGNRIVSNFKIKLGIQPGEKEDQDVKADQLLKDLRKEWKRLTDGVIEGKRKFDFKKDGLISNLTELTLVDAYAKLLSAEERHFKQIEKELEYYPIYNEFLKGVRGCGPAMAGVIVTQLDPHKAKYPSSFWKYCGLDTVNGEGRSKKSDHLEKVTYTAKDGTVKEKNSISYNPFLKTKMVGVLGASFVKASGYYSEVYRNYKERLKNNPKHEEKTDGHRHNMAIRYAVKQFLADLHLKWREIEGLPVHSPYSDGKLGMKHGKDE